MLDKLNRTTYELNFLSISIAWHIEAPKFEKYYFRKIFQFTQRLFAQPVQQLIYTDILSHHRLYVKGKACVRWSKKMWGIKKLHQQQ